MNLDEIRLRGKNRKVLVICNTVSKAQKLYKKLEGENVWLLHSKYIRRDRAFLERKIMGFSESGESGIWITTQIVEASLDIDFDIYRRKNELRAVKKNCTIPSWLNYEAEKANINFSQVLQNALMEQLKISR